MHLVLFMRAGCSWEAFDELSKGYDVSGRTVRNRLADSRRTGVSDKGYEVLRRMLDHASTARPGQQDARRGRRGQDLRPGWAARRVCWAHVQAAHTAQIPPQE